MTAAIFDLRLSPNRSLARRHSRWLIGGVGAVFLLGGLRFLALGAWPVLPFMAVDLALLWWAFRASYRSGRAYERLHLDHHGLTIAKVSAQGRERRVRLEPYWTRVQLETLAADDNRLWLACREARIAVGQCLSPAERVEVHRVIAAGLAQYRRA